MDDSFPAELAGAWPILATTPLAILAVNRGGRISWANDRLEEMFGYGRGEMAGQPLENLVPERLRAAHATHRTGFFVDPHIRPMGLGLDLTGRRRDGSEFPVEISLSFVGTGEHLIALAFITDITLRKEAEKRLQTEFAVTSVFIESAPIDEVPARLVQVICESLDWPVGEFWSADGGQLGRAARWRRPDRKAPACATAGAEAANAPSA